MRKTSPLHESRENIDQADRLTDPSFQSVPRPLDDQGDSDGLFIKDVAVLPVAVLVESLAVIGGEDDERGFENLHLLEGLEKAPHLPVQIGDLTVIEIHELLDICGLARRFSIEHDGQEAIDIRRPGTEPVHELLGRQVLPMRIEKVKEQKKTSAARPPQQLQRFVDRFSGSRVSHGPINVEPSFKSERLRQVGAGDDTEGLVAGLGQQFGQVRLRAGKFFTPAGSVERGSQAGHHGHVSRKCP